jgi:hypothetical protein
MAVITNSTGRFQNFSHSTVAALSGATDPQSTAICPTIFAPESGSNASLVATSAAANSTTVVSATAPAAPTDSSPITQQLTGNNRDRNHSPAPYPAPSAASAARASTALEGTGPRQTQDPSGTTAEDLPPLPAEDPLVPPAGPPPMASTMEVGADLPGHKSTPADFLLDSVYGDHVHPNDGRHLDGGYSDDPLWQSRWLRMVQLAPIRYAVPKGKVEKRFLVLLTPEFRGVRERRWNSERPLVFAATILQTTPGVRRSQDTRRRLARRMDLWEQGCFAAS